MQNLFDRAAITALAGAGLLSVALAQTAAAEPINFPALDSSHIKIGAFVGPDHVRRITVGLNKDQVRLEMGNPHFSEGLWGVREWDYALNFYTGQDNAYVTCQYKVKFDEAYRVASTHWKNQECASHVLTVSAKAVPSPALAAPTIDSTPASTVATMPAQRVVLSADGMFSFGKSGLESLATAGHEKLVALASQLKQNMAGLVSVVVIGHTDHFGSSVANQALSQARADAVRGFLMLQGLDGKLIRSYGAGKSHPLVQCNEQTPMAQQVLCLQPNRRIEVEAIAVN